MEVNTLNLLGLKCPVPVLRARKAFKILSSGSCVRVECSDPLSEIDIPHMCITDGHELIDQGHVDQLFWFLVRIK